MSNKAFSGVAVTDRAERTSKLGTAGLATGMLLGTGSALAIAKSSGELRVVDEETATQQAISLCTESVGLEGVTITVDGMDITPDLSSGHAALVQECITGTLVDASPAAQALNDTNAKIALGYEFAVLAGSLLVGFVGAQAYRFGQALEYHLGAYSLAYDKQNLKPKDVYAGGEVLARRPNGVEEAIEDRLYQVVISPEGSTGEFYAVTEDTLAAIIYAFDCQEFRGKPLKQCVDKEWLQGRVVDIIEAINKIRTAKAVVAQSEDAGRFDQNDLYAYPDNKGLRPLIRMPDRTRISARTNLSALLRDTDYGPPATTIGQETRAPAPRMV